MRKTNSRPVAQTAERLNMDEIVGLWTAILWTVAAAYVLTTFQVY